MSFEWRTTERMSDWTNEELTVWAIDGLATVKTEGLNEPLDYVMVK